MCIEINFRQRLQLNWVAGNQWSEDDLTATTSRTYPLANMGSHVTVKMLRSELLCIMHFPTQPPPPIYLLIRQLTYLTTYPPACPLIYLSTQPSTFPLMHLSALFNYGYKHTRKTKDKVELSNKAKFNHFRGQNNLEYKTNETKASNLYIFQ